MMEKILVTGATGKLGSRVISALLKKVSPTQIVAFVRNIHKAGALIKKGIEVRIGDYTSKDSLDFALTGISRLLLISGPNSPDRFLLHKNVIDAAQQNGVQMIAYTGISLRDYQQSHICDLAESHFQTEDYLKSSGMSFVVLRNTLYADDLIYYIDWHHTLKNNQLLFPAGDGKVPWVLRDDMAIGIANLLAEQGSTNSVYEIGNSCSYTFSEIANELSVLTQRKISYIGDDPDRYVTMLTNKNFPEFIKAFLLRSSDDIRNNLYDINTGDLESLIGRKPISLSTMLRIVFEL